MTQSLAKGHRANVSTLVKMSTGGNLTNGRFGVGWDETGDKSVYGDFDLDLFLLLLGADGKLVGGNDGLVGYPANWRMNTNFEAKWFDDPSSLDDATAKAWPMFTCKNQSVIHMGDNKTGAGAGEDEKGLIDFGKLEAVTQILAVVNIYVEDEVAHTNRGGTIPTFAAVDNAFAQFTDLSSGKDDGPLIRADLSQGDISQYHCAVFAGLELDSGNWTVVNHSEGRPEGIEAFLMSKGWNS